MDTVANIVAEWRRERSDIEAAPMLVVGRIHRLAQMFDTALRPLFADAGLGNGEFDILAALRRAGAPYARTPRELGAALMVTSGAVSKQIDRLEQKGLLKREPDPRDARSRMIRLTEAGRRLVDRLLPEHVANEKVLVSPLTRTQTNQLAELLEMLALGVEDRTT